MTAALWWSWSRRIHFFDTMDFVAPLVPAGLGFGRIGNFIGGELWGKPTGAGWGVVFPRADLGPYSNLPMEELHKLHASGALDAYARHPSQLYQAFLEGLVMMVVLLWYSRRARPRYAVSGLFALLYGVFRILVEFVRVPDQQIGYLFGTGWVTEGQLLSLPLIAVGLGLLWLSRRSPIANAPAALSPATGG
jgi:phosphatidylglycerol:prolipoprotein diacylglycerol transferase